MIPKSERGIPNVKGWRPAVLANTERKSTEKVTAEEIQVVRGTLSPKGRKGRTPPIRLF